MRANAPSKRTRNPNFHPALTFAHPNPSARKRSIRITEEIRRAACARPRRPRRGSQLRAKPVINERPAQYAPRHRTDQKRHRDRGAAAVLGTLGQCVPFERNAIDRGLDARIQQLHQQHQQHGNDQQYPLDRANRHQHGARQQNRRQGNLLTKGAFLAQRRNNTVAGVPQRIQRTQRPAAFSRQRRRRSRRRSGRRSGRRGRRRLNRIAHDLLRVKVAAACLKCHKLSRTCDIFSPAQWRRTPEPQSSEKAQSRHPARYAGHTPCVGRLLCRSSFKVARGRPYTRAEGRIAVIRRFRFSRSPQMSAAGRIRNDVPGSHGADVRCPTS